jgi:hypothetical protein
MQSPVALGLSLLVIASVGRVSLQCDTGPIDSLPDPIVNVGVTENEVIGFSCNITSCAEDEFEEATLCIKETKHSNATSLRLFLQSTSMPQYNLSMLEISSDSGKKKNVNLRVKAAQFSSGDKDKAFVAHIQSGSTMFCINGESFKCYSNPVLLGSATKYMVRDDSTSTTISVRCTSEPIRSPIPTTSPILSVTSPQVVSPLGVALGTFSVISIAIIIALIFYIIYLKFHLKNKTTEAGKLCDCPAAELHNTVDTG